MGGLAALIGCGGSSTSVPAGPTATPIAIPIAIATTVPTLGPPLLTQANGAVTTLSSNGTSGFGSTVVLGSTAANFIVQAATQPTPPSGSGSTLRTFAVTVTETAGIATGAALRRPAAQHVHDVELDSHRDVPRSAFEAIERAIAALPRGPADAARITAGASRLPKFNPGDTHGFVVVNSTIGGGITGNTPLTATLMAQSAHANVWLDNEIFSNPTEYASEYPSGALDFTLLATEFDGYYTTEAQTFGSPFAPTMPTNFFLQCDANGTALPASLYLPQPDTTGADPHINLVITKKLAGSGEGGYFYTGDLFNQQTLNCLKNQVPVVPQTNGLPMFVMASDYYPLPGPPDAPIYNEPFWNGSDAPRTAAHEFQHLIHFINKFVVNIHPGAPTPAMDPTWIDEGASMLAEDLAANGIMIDTPRFTYEFLGAPDLYSLTAFTGYVRSPLSTDPNAPFGFYLNTAGNYGLSYLFMRYIYDRFGPRVIAQVVQSPLVGVANIETSTGEPFSQLYGEFVNAVALQNTGVTTDPRYRFAPQIVLRGPTTVTSRVKPSGSRVLNFAGPQPPTAFLAGVPSPLVLMPGGSLGLQLIDGATAYFAPQPTATGATVRAFTSGVAGIQGSLVQGGYTQGVPSNP